MQDLPVTKQIIKCGHSRAKKLEWRCHNDWCPDCSSVKTVKFRQEIDTFLHGKLGYWSTILISPIRTAKIGMTDAKCAIMEMARRGIDYIGVVEIATQEDTRTEVFTNFMKNTDYKPSRDKGIVHIHGLSLYPHKDLLGSIFPLSEQVKVTRVGSGNYASKSMQDNYDTLCGYMRKRIGITKHWWTDEVGCEQIVVRIIDGIVEILVNNSWQRVGERWGEPFKRLEDRWVKGVMRIGEEVGKDGSVWSGSNDQKGLGDCGRVEIGTQTVGYTNPSINLIHDPTGAWAILQKVKQQMLSESKPAIAPVVQKSNPVNELFYLPAIQPKPIKPKPITNEFIDNRNRHDIVCSGQHAGKTLDEMFADKGYIRRLKSTKGGYFKLRALCNSAVTTWSEYEEKTNAKRTKANARSERQNKKVSVGQSDVGGSTGEDLDCIASIQENAPAYQERG